MPANEARLAREARGVRILLFTVEMSVFIVLALAQVSGADEPENNDGDPGETGINYGDCSYGGILDGSKCQCFKGHTGTKCEGCAEGYFFPSGASEGTCLPSSCTADGTIPLCNGRGDCREADGTYSCQCAYGYSGQFCQNDACGLLTSLFEGASLVCGGRGDCVLQESTGTYACVCHKPFQGPLCESTPGLGYTETVLIATIIPVAVVVAGIVLLVVILVKR